MEPVILSDQRFIDSGPTAARHLLATGELEVLRLTKAIRSQGEVLEFAGIPARIGTKARGVRVRFTPEFLAVPPRFDAESGFIELYYPHRDHPEVQALLNAKRHRFCYYWRSQRSGQAHAWLLSSP